METTSGQSRNNLNDELEEIIPTPENQDSNSPKRKFSFKTLFETIQQTAFRFTFPLAFVVGLVVLLFISINQNKSDIDEKYWIFFGLGLVLSIAVSLFSENFNRKFIRLSITLLAVALLGIYILLLPEKLLTIHFYQIVVVGLSFTIGAFVVLFFRPNTDIQFWEFSKTTILQLIISFIFAQVLMLGLSLAVLSLNELFNIDISEKVYANIAVLCYGLFLPFYFLSNVPAETEIRKQDYKYDKFLKILGLYILLPILAIYTVILYVYLIQIIAVWKLPNGWVTWLVSVLALGGFLTLLIQYPLRVEKSKIPEIFARFFPIILFPLLILMTVGISRRFDDYGLTINRAFVFLLNFWLYGISIYLFISKSNHLKWILISFACVAFLSVVGPWSVLNITKYSMKQELVNILTQNNYLVNNKVVSLKLAEKINITEDNQRSLTSKIGYLFDNYGFEVIKPLFEDNFKAHTQSAIFERLALDNQYYNIRNTDKYFNATLEDANFSFDITPYKHLVRIKITNSELIFNDSLYKIVYQNEQLELTKIKDPESRIAIKLKPIIDKLYSMDSNNFTIQKMSFLGENYKMLIVTIGAQSNETKTKMKIDYFEGYLFLK